MYNGELTAKQGRFCIEYLVDFNATQAAIRAGYCPSPRVAAAQGHENLRKPEIRNCIRALVAERNTRTLVAADRVMGELAKIAFGNLSVTTRDRLRALDMLAKHTQAFRRQSYDVPEFLTANERLSALANAVPDDYQNFFALAVLLGPKEKDAMSKALKKMQEQKRQQLEASKARTGRATIPYDPDAPTTHIGLIKKVLGAKRIKRSVEKVLDELLSGRQKQPTLKYDVGHFDQWFVERIAAYEKVSA